MTAKEISDMYNSIYYWLNQLHEAEKMLSEITARLMAEVEKRRKP